MTKLCQSHWRRGHSRASRARLWLHLVPLGAELKIPSMTVLTATLTCPVCGHKKAETMPTNACVHFYECTGCGTVLRPKVGDCCVFCSYGSSRCPPRQAEGP